MNESIQFQELTVVTPGALASIAGAEADIKIRTAKMYPRDVKAFLDKAKTMAVQTVEIAASCFYKLKRKGNPIEGPSIRCLEICCAAYGNLQIAARIIDIGETMVTAQGACHDLENNVSISVEVTRRITTKEGRRYGDDMIAVTCQAAIAIARRNAAAAVIPNAMVNQVYLAAKEAAAGKQAELRGRVAKMLKAFKDMGINEDRILAELDRQSDLDITLADMATLAGYHTSITEGENPEIIFPLLEDPTKKGTEALTEQLKKGK